MKNLLVLQVIFITIFISATNSLHLGEVRNLPESVETSPSNTSSNAVPANTTLAKGNLGSLTSIISNPTQLISQIQTTVNTFLQTLNNTLSGSSSNVTSLLGSLKNITNKPSGSFRLEEADSILANISEIVKTTKRSESELLNNSSAQFENQVHGAFQDFRKAIMALQSNMHDNVPEENLSSSPATLERKSDNSTSVTAEVESPENTSSIISNRRNRKANGLPRTLFDQISSLRTQVDTSIQKSLSNARSSIEGSLDIARQNSQVMRNQTSVFMTEIQRVFDEFSAPFRNFFEALRRGRPTAVVTA